MTHTSKQIAEAFSGHRFTEVYDHLAPDVRWVSVGGGVVEGRDAVIKVCEQSTAELSGVTTEFERFLAIAGPSDADPSDAGPSDADPSDADPSDARPSDADPRGAGGAVAVDAIGRYTDADQQVSVVSSCDIYEFRDDQVVLITSYTVELTP